MQAPLIDAVLEWWPAAHRDLPWRRPETTPYGVLVSEFMLQQTPVARVVPAYEAWLSRWPTLDDLAAAPSGEAVRQWGRLGYPRRAIRLHAACLACVSRHGGEIPTDVDALLALPGVGSYTARAVAAFAYGQRVPVVDVNVRRVIARAVEGTDETPAPVGPRDLALVETLLPGGAAAAVASAALMELGALVCTARTPACRGCPAHDSCAWVAAGAPVATGPARRGQGYAGTDRQVRGRLLAVLREAPGAVPPDRLDACWDEPAQRARALAGLVADGLVEVRGDGQFVLPGGGVRAR